MGPLRRWLHRLTESDEERLAQELRAWAAQIPGTVPIAEAPLRSRVKVTGMVRRITVRPVEGFLALEAVLWDGTAEVSARWLGRRTIPGMTLGSRLVITGVLGTDQGTLRMVNPIFEFAEASGPGRGSRP